MELITQCLESGSAAARLASNREAVLFRYALYHALRREKAQGLIAVSVHGAVVQLEKNQVRVQIVEDWRKAEEMSRD